MRRAIRVASDTGDLEWSGAAAHLGLADIAIHAGDFEIARLAIGEARQSDPAAPVDRYVRSLRRQLRPRVAEMRAPQDHHDAARKGVAVEHLIAATCMLASNLESNVSTSLVDDEGVDLVFHRRARSTTFAVQITSRSWSGAGMRSHQRFIAQIRTSTFRPRHDLFVIFVAIDTTFADYGPVWLVPSQTLAPVGGADRGRLRFVASAAPDSGDRWVRFRHERSELPDRLLEELELLDRVEPEP
jgi:hypothetical protein